MAMNIVVDRGNTLIKVGFFQKDQCLDVLTYNSLSGSQLVEIIGEYEKKYPGHGKVRFGIISSVVKDSGSFINGLKDRITVLELNSTLPVPVRIRYKTPFSLGNDRIAAAVGAISLFPNADLLVIDAGTCITYDFTNRNHEFLGGGISPGISMRFKAMHTFTGNLPLVEGIKETGLIGDSTVNSILSGVINGVFAEVEGIMDRYKSQFPDLMTVFTGGDLNYFDKYLKSDIFAVPNLVLKGLNGILEYNVKQ
jgi:type III pantothenate kinase